MRRGGVGIILKHQVPLYHLCLLQLVVEKLLVKDSHEAVLVVQDIVSDFGIWVAKFSDDVLNYLFVQFILHPVVRGSRKKFLSGVVLGDVAGAVLYTHEVVDNVEVVVDHVTTRHYVLVVESAWKWIFQGRGILYGLGIVVAGLGLVKQLIMLAAPHCLRLLIVWFYQRWFLGFLGLDGLRTNDLGCDWLLLWQGYID